MSVSLDEIAPNYRAAVERWPDAPTLASHYQAVFESFNGSGNSLIETVKSFIECVCLTILGDFGEAMPSATPSTRELLVASLRLLGLSNTRGVSKLDKVLSAYNKLSDAPNECRNEVGPVAHGKDGFLDVLYRSQLRTYLLTGDALLALVLGALEGTEPNLQHTREPYESFIRLHNRIDSSALVAASVDDDGEVPVFILSIGTPGLPEGVELRVEPSRLMYALDRGAYVEVLASSTVDLLEDAQSTEAEVPEGASSPAEATSAEVPLVRFTPAYSGKLGGVLSELASYLKTLSLRPDESLVDPDASLAPSLLATAELYMGVDWRDRQSLQSGMRVALIRILSRFGVPMAQAKLNAQHIASWLRIKVTTDLENPTG